MKKNNARISQQGQKRHLKNLARKQRRAAELNNHVKWVEAIVHSGVELDMDKLIYKKVGEDGKTRRDHKTTKLIIDRLVARNRK